MAPVDLQQSLPKDVGSIISVDAPDSSRSASDCKHRKPPFFVRCGSKGILGIFYQSLPPAVANPRAVTTEANDMSPIGKGSQRQRRSLHIFASSVPTAEDLIIKPRSSRRQCKVFDVAPHFQTLANASFILPGIDQCELLQQFPVPCATAP
jgi:hypothetical protein